MKSLAYEFLCLIILTTSEISLSGQCEESIGSVTPQRQDNMNAYILRGTTEHFKCISHITEGFVRNSICRAFALSTASSDN